MNLETTSALDSEIHPTIPKLKTDINIPTHHDIQKKVRLG